MKLRIAIPTMAVALALATSLGACSSTSDESDGSDKPTEVTVGVIARESPDWEHISDYFADKGLIISVKVFSDNVALNNATAEGSLDANYFQSLSYMNSFNESNGTKLEAYGPWTYTKANQLISEKFKTIAALPDGATIGIANDAFNRSRAFRQLAAAGMIELSNMDNDALLTVLDISENDKNLQFVETDPRSLVGAFADFDAMVIPSTTAFEMGDNPNIVILNEETEEVYGEFGGDYLVTVDVEANRDWMDRVIEYQLSDDYKTYLLDTWRGTKKPAPEGTVWP